LRRWRPRRGSFRNRPSPFQGRYLGKAYVHAIVTKSGFENVKFSKIFVRFLPRNFERKMMELKIHRKVISSGKYRTKIIPGAQNRLGEACFKND
jgi:hypothetical protein